MKKLLNSLKSIFHKIIIFFDKKVIIPITKRFLMLTKKFDKQGRVLENWLSKTNTLLFISLFLSITIFVVIDQKIIFFSESSAEVLKSQPVTAIYNEEAYVIEGIPETVDITLIGSKTDLYIAKQSPAKDVMVDLSGLKEGTHKVNIVYNNVSTTIDYAVNPSYATIIIYPKLSQTKSLTVDVLNSDLLDQKLNIDSIDVGIDEVVVKGAEYKLSEVATVKALVDMKNLIKQEIGTHTIKDVQLKAYDVQGNVVDVEIVPVKVDATITISSPSKEVPIKVIPKGEVAFGMAINMIEISETKVTVYGTQELLSKIDYIPVEIDVTNLKEAKEYRTEIIKPTGIKYMDVNSVTIKVTLGTVSTREIEKVNIDVRNLAEGYKATGLSAEDIMVTISLKGVETVINEITNDDIMVYIDLAGYGEGQFEVDVYVEGKDTKVQYISKTKKVKILISKKD